MDRTQELLTAINALIQHLNTPYTITGSSDWPMIKVMGGVMIALVGFMWVDLRNMIREHKNEWQGVFEIHSKNNKDEINDLWEETRAIHSKIDACVIRHDSKTKS